MKQKDRRRQSSSKLNLDLTPIEPMNETQQRVFDSCNNQVLHGSAGTGKTFLSSYLSYKDVIQSQRYGQLYYIRSAVPTRSIGFLPGDQEDKTKVYESPYKDIATELFNRGDAYDCLKKAEVVQFVTTSHIRGITIYDSCIIVDECQNMTFQELDSIITRVGKGCRLFFCGDFHQSDLKDTGIKDFYKILSQMPEFDFIEFGVQDIVRSSLVKNYLTKKYELLGTDSQLFS